MFSNTARTGFGGNASAFGSTAATNPFGATQMFGATPSSTFGAPAFGQASGNIFGAQPAQPQNQLFSSANTSTFGTQPQNAFGSTSLFGQQNPPASNSLFGGSSAFGQQNKQPGYSFPTPQAGLFGQTAAQPQQMNIFQPSTSSNIFGASSSAFGMPVQSGTAIKFQPVTGTDSMQKSGSTTVINTKHHSITCMKEYENKSFEELRLEDYSANRKGPQAGSAFGQTAAQPFASTSNTSIFGQAENKSAFGQANTFGSPAPAFGATQSNNIFGKPNTFGSAITTSSSGFGSFGAVQPQPQQQTTSIFGAQQPAKPFGQATPLFNSQPQQSSFGTSPFFGQTAASQPQSFFNKPAQPTFSTPQTGFSFGQTSAAAPTTGLFQQQPKTTGFSLFGTSTTTTAASAWPSSSAFGANAFAKPAQPAFGQPTQPSFGTSLTLPQSNLFGNLGAKPAFGTTPQTNLFGNTSLQPSTGFGMTQQQMAQPVTLNTSSQLNDLRSMIAHSDPYGYSPHLDNLDAFKPSGGTHYVTNPKDIDNYLKESENNIANVTPKSKKIQVKSPCAMEKWKMFEASYENSQETTGSGQVINKRVKRLSIRSDPNLKRPEPIYIIKDGRLIGKNSENDIITISSPPRALQITNSSSETNTSNRTSSISVISSSMPTSNVRSAPELAGKLPESDSNKQQTDVDAPSALTPRLGVVNIDSLDDTSQQKCMSSAEIADTCGVICTRPQYYTLPALDKLSQFKNADGNCFIKGFTIGRHGYGNVHFPDVINITNLNIDELVHFRHKQIYIYLDDNTKPPVGEGLNRAAQVTLDRVFPSKHKDISSNEQDSQAKEMPEIAFEEVLQSACLRAGTTFVDYRPETGSWVFNVEHFSKYGLLDSDEADIRREVSQGRNRADVSTETENAAQEQQDKSKDTVEKAQEVSPPAKKGLGGVVMEVEQHQQIPEQQEGAEGFFAGASSLVDYADYASPMRNFDAMYESSRWDQDRVPKRNMQLMQMKYMFYNEDPLGRKADKIIEGEEMDGVQDISLSPETSALSMQADEAARTVRDGPKMYALKNSSHRVPMAKSLLLNRGQMDAGIFKGRSFKCGWGPGLRFYGLTDNGARVSEIQVSQAMDAMQQKEDVDPFKNMENLDQFIDLIYKETALQLEDDTGIPFFQMAQNLHEELPVDGEESLLARLFKLSENLAKKHSRNKHMAYYHSVWKLISAFWEAPPTRINVDHYRHEMFNQWLEHVTGPIINGILGGQDEYSPSKNIMTYLSGHRIIDAIKVASRSGHPQLSLIIAQLNSPLAVKSDLCMQLGFWQNTGSDQFVDDDIRNIYILCSGQATLTDTNILTDFDWLRCLALHFWYIVPSAKNLKDSILTYQHAFETAKKAAEPFSKYATIQDTWDILYYIMQLYCHNQNSLEVLLSPQTHTSDPNDYRMSWLLQQAFQSMRVGIVTDECHQLTTTSFATQLEEFEQYKWAIFVLLHLKDTIVRKNLVMGLLDRQLAKMDGELEEYIVEQFHIPSAWLHEVKAAQSKLLGMHWQAYKHLCYSQQVHDAHELLIMELAPILVGNDQFRILYQLLEDIESEQSQIKRWKYQGGLVMQFIQFWQVMQGFQERQDIPLSEISSIHMKLNQLLAYLRCYAVKDYRQAMVMAEMSKYCTRFCTILIKYARVSEHGAPDFSNLFSSTVMPFDYKYAEIKKVIECSSRM